MLRPQIHVAHHVTPAALAKETRLLCPHCNRALFVQIPNPGLRNKVIHDAIEYHRGECPMVTDEARVFQVDRPLM